MPGTVEVEQFGHKHDDKGRQVDSKVHCIILGVETCQHKPASTN